MPELPEVETIRRELEPQLCGQAVSKVIIRNSNLRWPVPAELSDSITGEVIRSVARRGKYLLLSINEGAVLVHLGMAGSLQIIPANNYYKTHDHVIIILGNGNSLRFNDPRRFGSVLWVRGDPKEHPLLVKMGPEPFAADCTANYLYKLAKNRRVAAKLFLMNGQVIAGVGNIYANEALFRAKIHPKTPVGSLTNLQWELLLAAVREVLSAAIENCGTTFKDFKTSNGRHGGFQEFLQVYGRDGRKCKLCGSILQKTTMGQRYTVFCPTCQA